MVYSQEFANAMRLTAADLLSEFNPATAYSHSDEITLIFPASMTTENFEKKIAPLSEHAFNGKVFKLLTLTASYASVRFTFNLMKELQKTKSSCYDHYFGDDCDSLTFDARLMMFPKELQNGEILNHMIWRSKMDCHRNFVSMFAERHFSQKVLDGMSTAQRIEKLRDMGIDLTRDDMMDMKYGVYVKRHVVLDQSGIMKHRITFFSLPKLRFSEECINLLTEKTFTNSREDTTGVSGEIVFT